MNWPAINKILNILLIMLITGYTLYYIYRKPAYNSGEKAKDFTATLPNGDTFHLSDLKGRYIVLNFWASWCGPCRKESPLIYAFYNETRELHFSNASGIEVVTIGMETKKENWEKARETDRHVWKYQTAEFDRLSGPIATLYGIKQIPTRYFIGPDGTILMVNPTFSEIKDYLADKEEK